MATLEFINVSHSYDISKKSNNPDEKKTEWAIRDMNITWKDGTANALLGPSGCGKTTMLNILSGLLKPTQGRVLVDGKDVTDLPPEKRHIAQVFQFPVVYDSMDVYNNLAFPLINMGIDKKEMHKKVEEVAEILNLTKYLRSSSAKLNSAEKQKVSLGRGIIRDDTVALLLDEPLTLIDPKMRGDLRRSLKRIQAEVEITMMYVTHDQHEALTFADYVTIVKDGFLVQTDTPQGLYAEPANTFVGYFIGSPGMNVINNCELKDDYFESQDIRIKLNAQIVSKLPDKNNKYQLGIRPEELKVYKEDRSNGDVKAKIAIIENIGSYKILTLETGQMRIKSRVDESYSIAEGEHVYLHFPAEEIKIFFNDHRIY
jgi:glycerol transport system ATP-binding protein